MVALTYPRTQAWFESLPAAGLDAFPANLASTRLPRLVAQQYPQMSTLPKLHPAWRLALAAPMPEGGWMPETTLILQYLLLRDAFFETDEAYFVATQARVKQSFLHPAIRPLMALMSPHLLILGASSRWAQYHRGSTLKVTSRSAKNLVGSLTFPPGLYPPLMIEDTRVAIAAAIELTNKEITHLTVTLTAPGVCAIEGGWA